LSQQYRETLIAEADYNYAKATDHLEYQNANRQEQINENTKELERTKNYFNQKNKNGELSNEEYIEYQSKINELNDKIATDQKVIADNKKVIKEQYDIYLETAHPFTVLKEKQNAVLSESTDKLNKANVPDALQTGKETAQNFYDAKQNDQIAQRQLESAKQLTADAAEKGKLHAQANGLDPTNPNNWGPYKEKYDYNKSQQDVSQINANNKKAA
jgi:hypothetical protein